MLLKSRGRQAHRSQQMQRAQDPLGSKQPVRDQTHKQRRDNSPQRRHGHQPPHLPALKAERITRVAGQGDSPSAPDEELQEHQDRQAGTHERRVVRCHRMLLASGN